MSILRLFFLSVLVTAASAAAAVPSEFDRTAPPLTYEAGFGSLSWKTSGPFTGITKNFRANPIPYRMEVAIFSVAAPVRFHGSFWRRFEFVHSAVWSAITRGPENHWGGVVTGLRFHYDLPGPLPIALFASWQGGVGGIDASGQRYAQEKDLTFAYLNAVGLRTQLTSALALHVQLQGQHISNGWQTHPSEGIDCAGWSFALSYRPRVR
jgi:hypothetical protein